MHFEDLDPHRFEDLVRQLIYTWKDWNALEATGRMGADDGFDIRGTELITHQPILSPVSAEDGSDEELSIEEIHHRIWMIQCKRMKSIGPRAVKEIISDCIPEGGDPPFGYLLVASCDFSKKARDEFHIEAAKRGVNEAHIWGKAELEDRLFLPENDHLLFGYFNISFKVRRRTKQTELRSQLTMKRALVRTLGAVDMKLYENVLIRDADSSEYPYYGDISSFHDTRPWWYYSIEGHSPPGHLLVRLHSYYAYISDDEMHWDALMGQEVNPTSYLNEERLGLQEPTHSYTEYEVSQYWEENVPKGNRAMLVVRRFIPYDRILAVDPIGDSYNPGTQLLMDWDPKNGPFTPQIAIWIDKIYYEGMSEKILKASNDNLVNYFANDAPGFTTNRPLEG